MSYSELKTSSNTIQEFKVLTFAKIALTPYIANNMVGTTFLVYNHVLSHNW